MMAVTVIYSIKLYCVGRCFVGKAS